MDGVSGSRPTLSSAHAAVASDLQHVLNKLRAALPLDTDHPPSSAALQLLADDFRSIRQILIDHIDRQQARDAFRHADGFNAVLEALKSLEGWYRPASVTRDERADFFGLLKAALDVLSESLHGHVGNQRYFKKRAGGGGWAALEQALGGTGACRGSGDHEAGQKQLFGTLLAFSLGEETLARALTATRDAVINAKTTPNNPSTVQDDESTEEQAAPITAEAQLDAGQAMVKKHLSGSELLLNPGALPMIVRFLTSAHVEDPLAAAVLLFLNEVAEMSTFNALAMHDTRLLDLLIPLGLDGDDSNIRTLAVRSLVRKLLPFGLQDSAAAQALFERAASSASASQLLLAAMRASGTPPLVQFDLSMHGYSAIELPTLGRPFPPLSPSLGYTFTGWIKIDRFDPECHTTIFGAYDASQKSFLLAYLEKDSHQFILQTSMSPADTKPSVRFKSTTFKEGIWYHVAIVHRRPRTTSSSKAAFFINGQLVEQIKCQYPAQAASPPSRESTDDPASSTSKPGSRPRPSSVQAFLGTPQDLAARLGRNIVKTRWSLATFHLFSEALSDELITVYQKLGPRYNGNFQDCLGSFQTYQASAELNLYNEILHPGKEEQSNIVSAIKGKGGLVLPEGLLAFSFSPTNILDDNDNNNVNETQLVKSLSKPAAKVMHKFVRGGQAIAVNAAIPSINEALTLPNGVAFLVGDPVVAVPRAMDTLAWCVSGFVPLALRLISLAQTDDAVLRAVDILFAGFDGSWRNSEAMEKDNGAAFAVLMTVLREKLEISSLSSDGGASTGGMTAVPTRTQQELQTLADGLLVRILNLVGFNPEHPDESVLVNPLAYRGLLVDFDTWTRMPAMTQQLYYRQLGFFIEGNKYRNFNAKRLMRIRIIKRMLDPLKSGTILAAAFPDFLSSLTALVKCSQSPDVLRALALFITYALHDARATALAAKRTRAWPANAGSESSTPPIRLLDQEPRMDRGDIGVRVLEMYTDLLCDPTTTSDMKRFAKTVSNKWLLYLLAEPSPQAVFLSAKILARLIVLHGPHYAESFNERSGGFSIMKLRLRNWWNMPAMWTICFAILFGYDVALIDFERDFNLFNLIDTFPESQLEIVHTEMLPVIGAMLEAGLRSIVNERNAIPEPERAPSPDERPAEAGTEGQTLHPPQRSRPRSMSLRTEDENAKRDGARTPEQRITSDAEVLQAVIHFLADLHDKHNAFRTFALTSSYVQELLFVLYPIVVTADAVSAETELYSRGSALNFEGRDVVIRPHNGSGAQDPPVVRASFVEPPPSPTTERATPLRRGSSFVLLTKDKRQQLEPSLARLTPAMASKSPNVAPVSLQVGNALVEGLLEVVVGIFLDQILSRKDFTGFGLFLKVPPGFQEHQAYFESYVLTYAMNALSSTFKLRQKLMTEPRVLTNIARYVLHMAEAVFEGWFLDGAEHLLDFIGQYLEYLQRPEIASLKDVRLCGGAITTMRQVFYRVVLLRLSELHHATDTAGTVTFLNKMVYWQTVLLGSDENEGYWLRLICYLLYTELISPDTDVRTAAANLWRMILVQKPTETTQLIEYHANSAQHHLSAGFLGLAHTDNEAFLHWIDDHRSDLNSLFFGSMSQAWETFVKEENAKTEESAKHRIAKRKDKLRQWHVEQSRAEDVCRRHETSTPHWRHNVHAAERLKHQRALQDQQENLAFTAATLSKSKQRLEEPVAVFSSAPSSVKWQLDETEGRNRMRLRMIRDRTVRQEAYQPKRRKTVASRNNLRLDTNVKPVSAKDMIGATPAVARASESTRDTEGRSGRARSNSQLTTDSARQDEEYEIVEDPNEDEAFDDKKRRVQRSLQMHDTILSVCNVARIVGLEAVEGLLVIGKDNLYMMDEFFERSDKEVVRSWQAPAEERDPYLQLISGNQQAAPARRHTADANERSARHWSWQEVLSFSKRRFLFRDVAIEVFFTDGRSYLLTCKTPFIRDDLYLKLVARAPQVHNSASSLDPDDRWRLEALRNPEEVPQGFGTKFASVFNQASSNPATKRWLRGELSNFAYLMLINTMAGRTFNDLTQYPVFPWVIADYQSEELDLSDPRTFRDFSKPMGCQTPSREAEFRERYHTFAEMGDNNAPPFHYGTHYSSAMIVTSYLIRLQPFVQSYLLLQGGAFDHADRLFYSIEKAWLSASRDNMTDVRELTPEFYYLPEFLSNINQYDFGAREATGEVIIGVALPPWAKGDPAIFIAKQREALESPYVRAHLHQWIDLVFGYKQRGDQAVEATNVFHHLSYHGAKDLDAIEDPVERLATIGIIHNFGQTPHQVFHRAHPKHDESAFHRRLDNSAESLTKLPFALLESGERVSSLLYSTKHDRLFCSAALRLNIPPFYERYMEWGFADGSIRFFSTESRKMLGLFEHLHESQISTATFIDSKTLITAGNDCVISLWNLKFGSKTMDLHPRISFFGHRSPVTVLATSRAFSTFLSASLDGKVYLWDLNRSDFVRSLDTGGRSVQCARINNVTGNVMLCCGPDVLLYSLNGKLLCEQDVCASHEADSVMSCAFFEGNGNEWLEHELVFTGHQRGVVNVWKVSIADDGKWILALIKRLDHADTRMGDPAGKPAAAITCILPAMQSVYTGDEDGRVCQWDCLKST